MHKSIVILLLGLLAFLLPFGPSSMSISNVIAITENEYYTDQYMGYAEDMVNEYEDSSSYANNDGYKPDRSSYGNNNYDSEYPSYKSDYKQHSNSYEYDDKYKSKDIVSISKINCINNNVNINGNNTGDINVGNSGRGVSADDGTNGGVLAGNEFGNDGERYSDGYNKKDNGIVCEIDNSNNNTIITTGGNATDGDVPEPITCELCFTLNANELEIERIEERLFEFTEESEEIGTLTTIEQLCQALRNAVPLTPEGNEVVVNLLRDITADLLVQNADAILECLEELGLVDLPPDSGLSNLPTIAQGIGDSPALTAMEKITKLKTQWMELTP
jgi:hypothetical protein